MNSRYLDADDGLTEVFLHIIETRFPRMQHLNIKLLYDLKKRISKGKITLASVESTSEKLKFFTKDDRAIEGYDLILIVDHKAWELASEKDQRRLMSHEMRHVEIDENNKVRIVDHEITDFYIEMKMNEDDPEWARKLTGLVFDIYEQEKIMAKEKKEG